MIKRFCECCGRKLPRKHLILRYLKIYPGSTAEQVAAGIGCTKGSVEVGVTALRKEGKIAPSYGIYRLKEAEDGTGNSPERQKDVHS
jgi:hypothetical protein